MGLLTGLLTLPLAPVRGVSWLAQQLLEQAEQQMYDPASVRRQVAEIEAAVTAGELSEEDATELENELLSRMMTRRAAGAEGDRGFPRSP
ncbi:gas vesicle protein GvpG [Actinomadura sp. DC4]|uniref:gas vesicle protein GvpG n=1 Tax=Actinomadura sp. DC4 TaxID=3055069 RepID=UPI0025B1C31B|nr:gas vesicle protein GvpG [Actinomadura sp. DC4]MDN3358826.1 gas vesicle protein GvpG [Actinomadura sp. DC4]